MTDRRSVERKELKDALRKNWDRRKDHLFPSGPSTRDDRYVTGAIAIARDADVSAILGGAFPGPDLQREWLGYHDEWVEAEFPRVVAEAIARLRAMRSDELAERRRKRKNVHRNGRRTKVNKRGRQPSRKLNLTCKSGLTKRRA